MRFGRVWSVLLPFLIGCDGCGPQAGGPADVSDAASSVDRTSPPTGSANAESASACPKLDDGRIIGKLTDPALADASGLVVSRKNPGLLWLHNDSGHANELFAIKMTEPVATSTYVLSGSESIDWEDIALGPGPDPDFDYIYVADLGANKKPRDLFTIYRVKEPSIATSRADAGAAGERELTEVAPLHFRYADGESHDAEAVMLDPRTRDIVLVTKSPTGDSVVFRAHPPDAASTPEVLERVVDLKVPHDQRRGSGQVTGGDISRDGSQILVRTYTDIFWWRRAAGQSLAKAFAGPRCRVSIAKEPQGEAIAFAPDGRSYFTVSEGKHQPVREFRRSN